MNFIEPADYSEGSQLDQITKDIILKMAGVEKLMEHTRKQMAAIKK
ncbi:MAG: hypothetical protein IJV18_00290 [Acidaminococcaceae bacterium]|nr:hypothetical protein [Acidaminococcaceae bacterium]